MTMVCRQQAARHKDEQRIRINLARGATPRHRENIKMAAKLF